MTDAAFKAALANWEDNTQVDITGMRKEAVLCALWNGTRSCGMGFVALAAFGDQGFTRDKARQEILDNLKNGDRMYFDYLHGKRMKLHLSWDVVDIRRFNSGVDEKGLGQHILSELKKDKSAFYESEQEMRDDYIWQAAQVLKKK